MIEAVRQRFEQIYERNEWGNGSGEGSEPRHTRKYVGLLRSFIKSQSIRSVVDLGCGDWQFSRFIDWTGVEYDGFDLVRSVINTNNQMFAKPNVRFHVFSGDYGDLPSADLLIVKDVLQHWSNSRVQAFLPLVSTYRHALITNCVRPDGITQNEDIIDGGFRYLDIRRPPFNFPAKEIGQFHQCRPLLQRWRAPQWRKLVLSVDQVS